MELERIYEGKAKTLFKGPEENEVFIFFKDDTTAFDGKKKEVLKEKGEINLQITRYIFRYLEKNGIPTHYLKPVDERTILAKKVKILPVEFIIRNVAAGGLTKRLGIPEGTKLPNIILEYCYKSDEYGDPMINAYHVQAMGLASDKDLALASEYSFRINHLLKELFDKVGIELVDFKVEFGIDSEGKLVLADEISPDSCRLWDKKTSDKMDKDVFRRDLGDMVSKYKEVLKRLQEELND
ncbi:MAG: phosphoribosylaminoimidazolesuccinocarboxamide synthase [Candidatus Muiribacteriota bacterium]|jgi:phosphoribosylaminoimidazole-succinocarboxamide synthase